MMNVILHVLLLSTVKASIWQRILETSDGNLTKIQQIDDDLYFLGKDVIFKIKSNSQTSERYEVTGSQKSLSECSRSGQLPLKYCHNFIREIMSYSSDGRQKILYCGTDSAARSCVNLNDRSEVYRVDDIVGFTPTAQTAAKKISKTQIISAGPSSIDELTFGIFISEMDGNRFSRTQLTNPSLFSGTVKFVGIGETPSRFIIFGRQWDKQQEKLNSFAASICKNDPASVKTETFISTRMIKLNCCQERHCFPVLQQGHFVNKTTFLGLFINADSESAICSFDLTDIDRSTCDNHQKTLPITARKHLTATPLYTTTAVKQFAIKDLTFGSVIALITSDGVQKLSLVDGVILKNYVFKIPELTDAKVLASGIRGEHLFITTSSGIEMVDLSSCYLYGTSKSVCLAIEDLLCGWNEETVTCETTVTNGKLMQKVKGDTDQNIEIQVDPEIIIQRSNSNPVTISTLTNGTLCNELKWFNERFEPVPMDDYRYFISYSPEHKRAQLVLYPPQKRINQLDGLYYLEYLIRGQSVRRSRFRVVPFTDEPVLRTAASLISFTTAVNVDENLVMPLTADHKAGLWSLLVIPIIALAIVAAILHRNRTSHSSQSKSASILEYYNEHDYTGGQYSLKKRRDPSGDSFHANSRDEWIERERPIGSNQSQESGFASDVSQQNQSISSPKGCKSITPMDATSYHDKEETLYLSFPSTSFGSSESSDDPSSDDCTITPDDAVVIFPDGTMRRIHAQRILQLKSCGKEISQQEERLLVGTLSATLKRKNKQSPS